jgi:glycosyltransferase involved in cell wall biosynthesis
VTLLIPAKNEERNLAWVLHRVPPMIDEVILIDGHSTDRTVDVARAVRPDVVVVMERTRGKGAAVRTGIAAASGDFVVMIDADGSMDPFEIPRYVAQLEDGADVVKGSRFLPGGGSSDMTRIRRVGNRALLTMVNGLFRTRFTELCYGFMAFRRDHMVSLGLTSDGFEIETEIVVRAARQGLTIREVPSFEASRRFGESHLNTFRDGTRVLRTIVARRASWSSTASPTTLLSADVEPFALTLAPADEAEEREVVSA